MKKQPNELSDNASQTSSNQRDNGSRLVRRPWTRLLIAFGAILYILYAYRQYFATTLNSVLLGILHQTGNGTSRQPNIVFILTDDQDVRLGSLDRMSVLQKRLVNEGTQFTNHYGTVALCCPGRATLLRGQQAHNTNITHVGGIGGGYTKWRRTGEWQSYLPVWLKQAGYNTAYFGKFLNGYGLHNYQKVPEEWDWTDILPGPYIYNFEHVVTSENGERPKYYEGWHQIDVLRMKALRRLEAFTTQDKPFYLEVAPVTPHVVPGGHPTIPPIRHNDTFPGLKAPRSPNWNPPDNYTEQKAAWLKNMPSMDENVTYWSDLAYQKRAEALLGVDDLVSDIIEFLEEKGILNNTFIIYTSDNGFHLGQHRLAGGKGQPYVEDTNLPFVVRGPGIPRGFQSSIPQSHVDVAPTLLSIAGLPRCEWPSFFDGRSLLDEWRTLQPSSENVSREVLNVEFWGGTVVPAGPYTKHVNKNSYKSLRIVNETQGYLFNRWCYSNETDFYNTTADPFELVNLAINPSNETKRIMDRLAGLLLVTKSCGEDTCRQPWEVLKADYNAAVNQGSKHGYATFNTLDEAMAPEYDSFFASLPHFGFKECINFQHTENETPYYPASSEILGRQHRDWLDPDVVGLGKCAGAEDDDTVVWESNGTMVSASKHVMSEDIGSWRQRHATFEDLMKDARPLTGEEVGWPVVRCDATNEWCGMEYDDD